MKKLKISKKVKIFAGINFRGRRILKNFAELTFAEKAKKRETAKVSDLKVHFFGETFLVLRIIKNKLLAIRTNFLFLF